MDETMPDISIDSLEFLFYLKNVEFDLKNFEFWTFYRVFSSQTKVTKVVKLLSFLLKLNER